MASYKLLGRRNTQRDHLHLYLLGHKVEDLVLPETDIICFNTFMTKFI